MVDDKENKELKAEKIKEATRVEESIAAYDLSPTMEENLIPREKVGPKLKGIPNSPQLAATSEEDGNMPQHYFDKYVDQRMSSTDEKIVGLRCELQSRTDSIHRTVDHALDEICERDNQRHSEIIAMETRSDAKHEKLLAELHVRDNQRHAEIMAMETKANERLEQSLAEICERDNQRHSEIIAMETKANERLEQSLAEMRERDNQRHAEIMAMETKANERLEQSLAEMRERDKQRYNETMANRAEMQELERQRHSAYIELRNKIDATNKWITAFVLGSLLSIAALILQALLK
jgi:putative N-acetylmannosamine-6-phosphate epimerase